MSKQKIVKGVIKMSCSNGKINLVKKSDFKVLPCQLTPRAGKKGGK